MLLKSSQVGCSVCIWQLKPSFYSLLNRSLAVPSQRLSRELTICTKFHRNLFKKTFIFMLKLETGRFVTVSGTISVCRIERFPIQTMAKHYETKLIQTVDFAIKFWHFGKKGKNDQIKSVPHMKFSFKTYFLVAARKQNMHSQWMFLKRTKNKLNE